MTVSWPETSDGGLLGDGRFAAATDRPANLDALREAVVRRVEEGHALYPQGGRTALDFGGVPRDPGVALDLRGLDRVIDYPAADLTVTVEAGITLAALQARLAENRQRLPLSAPEADRATLGGIYATNTSGPLRFGWGRPRDLIIGVRFVTAEGELVKGGGRVVKNVAGYDFPKLLTGSMGTLGILAEMTFKVRPIPAFTAVASVGFPDLDPVAATLARLNTSATRPVAIELLNRQAVKRSPGLGGLPDADWTLLVGYEGDEPVVGWQLDQLDGELDPAAAGVVRFRGDESQPVWAALTEIPALAPGPLSLLANVRRGAVVPWLRELDSSTWAVQAHAGSGIVRAHALAPWELEPAAAEVARLRAMAVRSGGNLILPRCPTAWKERLGVWGEPRDDWRICERIKAALDPRHVLNPGRFVGTI